MKGLHFIVMFFQRSLNKGAPKHASGDVLGSLQCPKGLYYSVALFEGGFMKSTWERSCFLLSKIKSSEEPQHMSCGRKTYSTFLVCRL